MATIVRKCRTCNRQFTISEQEQRWLYKKELGLFSHCAECRKARKEAATAQRTGETK